MSQMQILLQCRMHPVQTNEKIKNAKKKIRIALTVCFGLP